MQKDTKNRLSWPDLLHHPFVASGMFFLYVVVRFGFGFLGLDLNYLEQCAHEGWVLASSRPSTASVTRIKSAPAKVGDGKGEREREREGGS